MTTEKKTDLIAEVQRKLDNPEPIVAKTRGFTNVTVIPATFRSKLVTIAEMILALYGLRQSGMEFKKFEDELDVALKKLFELAVDAGFHDDNKEVLFNDLKWIIMDVDNKRISKVANQMTLLSVPKSIRITPIKPIVPSTRVMIIENAISDLRVRFLATAGQPHQKLSDFDVLGRVTIEIWNLYIPDRPVHDEQELRYELSKVHGEELQVLRDNLTEMN